MLAMRVLLTAGVYHLQWLAALSQLEDILVCYSWSKMHRHRSQLRVGTFLVPNGRQLFLFKEDVFSLKESVGSEEDASR